MGISEKLFRGVKGTVKVKNHGERASKKCPRHPLGSSGSEKADFQAALPSGWDSRRQRNLRVKGGVGEEEEHEKSHRRVKLRGGDSGSVSRPPPRKLEYGVSGRR